MSCCIDLGSEGLTLLSLLVFTLTPSLAFACATPFLIGERRQVGGSDNGQEYPQTYNDV